jgi:hypothetical protein
VQLGLPLDIHGIGRIESVCVTNFEPAAIEKIKRWISNCDAYHQCAPQDAVLPTRVLDLGTTPHSHVRLVTGKTPDRYVAFSYCWGMLSEGTVRTLSSNLADHCQVGVPVGELPTALRDVISLVRSLGYRYLWIDALCIIQDDPGDWASEVSRMGSYYVDADLVIYNNTSDSCRKPMFINQIYGSTLCAKPFTPHHLSIWSRCNDYLPVFLRPFTLGQTAGPLGRPAPDVCSIVVRYHPQWAHGLFYDNILSPLMTRAWVFQELTLAKRRLLLSPIEMAWHCLDTDACECAGHAAALISRPGARQQFNHEKEITRGIFGPSETTISDQQVRMAWRVFTQIYSQTQLSDPLDRNVAILGGVSHFSRAWRRVLGKEPPEYHAGIWRHDTGCIEEFLWFAQTAADGLRANPDAWATLEAIIGGGDTTMAASGLKSLNELFAGLQNRTFFVDGGIVGSQGFDAGKPRPTLEVERRLRRKTFFGLRLSPSFPSWSWLSTDYPILWLQPPSVQEARFVPHATAIELSTTVDMLLDPKGRALRSTLVLRGRRIAVKLRSSITDHTTIYPSGLASLFVPKESGFGPVERGLREYVMALELSDHHVKFPDGTVCMFSRDSACLYGDVEKVYEGWGRDEMKYFLAQQSKFFRVRERVASLFSAARHDAKGKRPKRDSGPGDSSTTAGVGSDMFPCWPSPRRIGITHHPCKAADCRCHIGWSDSETDPFWAFELGSYFCKNHRGSVFRQTVFLVLRPSPYDKNRYVRVGAGWIMTPGQNPGWKSVFESADGSCCLGID